MIDHIESYRESDKTSNFLRDYLLLIIYNYPIPCFQIDLFCIFFTIFYLFYFFYFENAAILQGKVTIVHNADVIFYLEISCFM